VPAGLTVTEVSGREQPHEQPAECTHTTVKVTCSYPGAIAANNTDALVIVIGVSVTGASGTVTNGASVTGGGAGEASANTPITISAGEPPFGLSDFQFAVTGEDGALDPQAAGHPNAVTVGFDYNTISTIEGSSSTSISPAQPPKTISVELPLGLIGNPQSAPTCPQALLAQNEYGVRCPLASVIGAVAFTGSRAGYAISSPREEAPLVSPIFNVTAEHGYPAEFAIVAYNQAVFMYASVVHRPSGYVLKTTVPALPSAVTTSGVQLTFFGDPAREDGGATTPQPFFTNPGDCGATHGPLSATITVSSAVDPSHPVSKTAFLPAASGCNQLQFEPQLSLTPETTQADTPTGATLNLTVPQTNELGRTATPELKNATVTLPAGMTISPPAANGLSGCPESGPTGINLYAEEPGPDEQQHLVPGHCPAASQIGTVKITTPVLPAPLEGRLYLAEPKCGVTTQPACTETDAINGRLYGLYIEVEGSGITLKLPGSVSADPSTGQLTASFKENPQFPFSDLELTITGGPRAPLANPQQCGLATLTSVLVPWGAPETPDATPTSTFSVDANGARGACPASQTFGPVFSAGTDSTVAAGYAPVDLSFSRRDGEPDLSGIGVTLPPGLAAILAGVPLCGEAQANEGTCPAASQIGSTAVAAGAGPDPLWLHGQAYLTGPYRGAPFGLAIVVPANAGPFHLGNVVVRAAIYVNPTTAAITVISDPLPQSRDGVPFRLKTVTVSIDRQAFAFNPTNCAEQSITATIAGIQGANASVASPFAVGGCATLPFKPVLTASTTGRASRAAGASLDVKIASKGGPQPGGGEANIRSVKVDLPPQMPSRLSTLNKACLARVFEANPANCPKESDVGTASASTPVLAHPLAGPAYLVANGGAAFPDLEIVLQGEGVVLILDGKTDIKKGVTSSTFNTVPDAPISSFELKLPTGRFSILGSYLPHGTPYDFCGRTLNMPTAITGQNGAVIRQTTKIAVTGCPKAKHAGRARRPRKASHRRMGGRNS
jgi:hypothetical protein